LFDEAQTQGGVPIAGGGLGGQARLARGDQSHFGHGEKTVAQDQGQDGHEFQDEMGHGYSGMRCGDARGAYDSRSAAKGEVGEGA